jgi:hypothetical protein
MKMICRHPSALSKLQVTKGKAADFLLRDARRPSLNKLMVFAFGLACESRWQNASAWFGM